MASAINEADVGGDWVDDGLDRAFGQAGEWRFSRKRLFGFITTPLSDVELLVRLLLLAVLSIGFVKVKIEEAVYKVPDDFPDGVSLL